MPLNSFNVLRLIFALLVVITHSYPLSGAKTGDYLDQASGGQVSFSFIGLSGFFVISGYLVLQSLNRSRTMLDYFRKRVLRIFPGLFVVLLLTVLLGCFVYDGTWQQYVTNRTVWMYLPSNISLLFSRADIPGVFSHNPYGPAINGSLWSIVYEFSFYICLAILFFLKRPLQIATTISIWLLLLAGRLFWNQALSNHHFFVMELRLVLEFGPFFAAGALLALLRLEHDKRHRWIVLCLMVAFVAAIFWHIFDEAKFLILPPLVILVALTPMTFIAPRLERLGDVSYGVYIYAFPIQQTLVFFFGFHTPALMIAAIVISFLFGYASWHCVEKHALRLK